MIVNILKIEVHQRSMLKLKIHHHFKFKEAFLVRCSLFIDQQRSRIKITEWNWQNSRIWN